MDDLVERIVEWHDDTFDDPPSERDALDKFAEEVGEFRYTVGKKSSMRPKLDEMADVVISLIGWLYVVNQGEKEVTKDDFLWAVKEKLIKIEQREGQVIDGKFVKESDLDE